LVSDDSEYEFNNVNFSNIISNSKAMIIIVHNQVSFSNCKFSNIICNGDSEDSSLIRFESLKNGNTMKIYNTTINDCISNGAFLRIYGENTNLAYENISFSNITSFGSLISNKSIKVSIIFKLINIYMYMYINNLIY